MKIWMNGKIMDQQQAAVPVLDRGYLFGEGIFETFRSYQGTIPFIDKHFNRMEWSSTFIGIPFPHPHELRQGVHDVLQANNLRDARIKIILSGMGNTFSPVISRDFMDINTIILCEPFKPWPQEDYNNGVDLTVVHSIFNEPPPASNMKSTSWLTKMIARRELLEKDCFDGVLLNALGHVTETTTSNLFWVNNRTLVTAPSSAGLLAGVTRDIVMNLAKEEGLPVREVLIGEEELRKMPEIFITGSTLEVMPVTQLDGNPVGSGEVGEITRRLQELYNQRIKEEIKEENEEQESS